MAWTLNYKGLTGYRDSIAVADETSYTVLDLIGGIISGETGGAGATTIDGPDNVPYGDCYAEMYVERDTSIELKSLTLSDPVDQHLQDGDTIICTAWLAGNKRVRQQVKLGIAQIKRQALMSADPTNEPFYRTLNTAETDDLPTIYNTDNETVTDNPNVGGLQSGRPWT